MAFPLDNIDKKVQEAFKQNPNLKNKATKSASFTSDLKKEVEKLKDCILRHIDSDTTRNSIIIESNSDGTFVITFDETLVTLHSYFKNYPSNAYMPIMRNEGYTLKNAKWKNFFRRGGSGSAQHFIEKGIADYKRIYGDGLSIRVQKNFDDKYSAYNETIHEDIYY